MTQPKSSSGDAFQDSLNFVQKLWGGMNVPGLHTMHMPSLSVDELDKRIQDLRSVEAWLTMNVNMLKSSIQALEVQRATIATLHSLSGAMAKGMQGGKATAEKSSAEASPINQSAAWWSAMQDQFQQALKTASERSAKPRSAAKKRTTRKTST